MKLVSFDSLRTLEIPGVKSIKPSHWFREKETVRAADWILFPEYWQINALVYVWKKRIFPSPSTYHLGHDKIEMIRAFEAICPENTPFTRIFASTESAIEQVLDEFSFPFVAKEVRNARGEGVFFIENRIQFVNYAGNNEVLYIQEYLPIERDIRVVVIGSKVVTAYWREAREGCFHNNIARGGSMNFADVPVQVLELVERVSQELNINHAGFDIVDLDGHYYFLEFNPWFGTQALNAKGIGLGRLMLEYIHEQTIDPLKPNFPIIPKAS